MVSVYFETETQSELIGVFESEYTLKECLPALEAYAASAGMKVVTHTTEKSINDIRPLLKSDDCDY